MGGGSVLRKGGNANFCINYLCCMDLDGHPKLDPFIAFIISIYFNFQNTKINTHVPFNIFHCTIFYYVLYTWFFFAKHVSIVYQRSISKHISLKNMFRIQTLHTFSPHTREAEAGVSLSLRPSCPVWELNKPRDFLGLDDAALLVECLPSMH